VHLLRNSFRYAGRQHWDAIAKALKLVYTAPTEAAARERFGEFAEARGARYPAIVRLWDNAWASVRAVPGVRSGDPAGDLLDQRDRERQRPHPPSREGPRALPNEQAALKCVYMAIMSLDPTGTGRKRWTMRWNLPSTPSRSPSTAAGRK
jgi:putative transposase